MDIMILSCIKTRTYVAYQRDDTIEVKRVETGNMDFRHVYLWTTCFGVGVGGVIMFLQLDVLGKWVAETCSNNIEAW